MGPALSSAGRRFAALLLALLPAGAVGASRPAMDSAAVSPGATKLAAYLRIDTTNPPGNEAAGATWLAGILRTAGIEPELFLSPHGRTSLYARLPANSPAVPGASRPGALLLLHHIDVVPAGDGWRFPPFAGEIHDGELFGRGAIDCKSLGIAHLEAFLNVARSSELRHRDLIFLATADEESGGNEGVGDLLAQHPELFIHVAAVLTEGGVAKAVGGRPLYWGIEVAQKRPLWLELSASGRPGHASSANPESAAHRLIGGLARLTAAPISRRLTPEASSFLAAVARFDPQVRRTLAELASPESRNGALTSPGLDNLLTDSLQITTLSASERINVVAGTARAGIDVRLLPDTDEKICVSGIEKLLGPGIAVRILLTSPATRSSPAEGPLYEAMVAALDGGARTPVVPAFIPAFTDARYFRARGIPAYGLSPFALDADELRTVHAPDERIALEAFDRGVERMVRVVRALVLADLDSH
ncbi:MAG: M20/M25/M40 family metallo-hydrolase [Thermoanaerobaculia bacterium]